MTADPTTPRTRRFSIRATLEILGAAALAIAILGIGWVNRDRAPDKADTPAIASDKIPADKPRAGPRIVQRPAPPLARVPPAPRAPEQAVTKDDSALRLPPLETPAADAPPREAESTALLQSRMRRLVAASRRETERGDPVTGALIALQALPGNLELPYSSSLQAVERALYAAYFARREIAVLSGHFRFVRTATFSPDGKRIVTASRDKTARLWDARTGALIAVLKGHDGEVLTAAFSPDGGRVVTASVDGDARIWDGHDGAEIIVLKGHRGEVTSAVFSPAGGAVGQFVVTTSADKTARLWRAADGRPAAILRGHAGRVLGAVFSPDGRVVATVSSDTTARLWNVVDGGVVAVLRGHQKYVSAAAFDGEGNRFVTASADGTARIWDPRTGDEIAVLRGHGSYVNAAVFSPDGARIATASWGDKTARLWDAASGTEIAVLRDHVNWVNTANFNPSGRRVATASGDGAARLWDAANGKLVAVLRGHAGYVYSARFSPDGRLLVTASGDGTARIWNALGPVAITMGPAGSFPDAAPRIAVSPDDRLRASIADDNTVRILDRESGFEVVLRGHRGPINSVDFNQSGTRLVTASADGTARVWDTASGAETAVLPGAGNGVARAIFSLEGDRIFTRDDDGATRGYAIFSSLKELAVHLKSVLPRKLTRRQRRQNLLVINP